VRTVILRGGLYDGDEADVSDDLAVGETFDWPGFVAGSVSPVQDMLPEPPQERYRLVSEDEAEAVD
jgi:hypothetical protein